MKKKFIDISDTEMAIGDFVIYSTTRGNTSVLRYGIVTEITDKKIFLITSCQDTFWDGDSMKHVKKWTLQKDGKHIGFIYSSCMLVIDPLNVHIQARHLLKDAFDKRIESINKQEELK